MVECRMLCPDVEATFGKRCLVVECCVPTLRQRWPNVAWWSKYECCVLMLRQRWPNIHTTLAQRWPNVGMDVVYTWARRLKTRCDNVSPQRWPNVSQSWRLTLLQRWPNIFCYLGMWLYRAVQNKLLFSSCLVPFSFELSQKYSKKHHILEMLGETTVVALSSE